jgi:hypothetical protein
MQTNQGGVMGGKHDIYIIEVAGEYRVRPAVAVIDGSTKKLKIRNLTEEKVHLFFPPNFLTAVYQDSVTLDKKKSKDADIVDKNLDGTSLDVYLEYLVVINKNGVLIEAKGESAPSVIVDP